VKAPAQPQPAAPVAQPASPLAAWLVVIVAGIIGVLGAVNLYAQVIYEWKGTRASGQVLEFHRASGHSRTIDATVLAAPPGVAPFKWDVEDTMGWHEWQVGQSIPLLCARIHADHVSCVIDSYPDRYLWTFIMLATGGGIATWGACRLLRARPTAVT
jgi:hypothetical protein